MGKYELIMVGIHTVYLTNYSIEVATGYTVNTKNGENALKSFDDERFVHLYNNLGLVYYVDQNFLDFSDLTKRQKAQMVQYMINRKEVFQEEFISSLSQDCIRERETYCISFEFYETRVRECDN